jgi:diaminohydroxyphosphoribosylaminopyrimidine deaminase/5-amino-6-(5-phosphoribosylamino)uracil reductase
MTLDDVHMARAVRLGHRALGTTAENPPVGCVIAHGERIVGLGCTQPGGRPHAETQALAMAGAEAKGATAYVTLEPCAHRGRTAPCAEALIEAGVARVVSAHEDPDPRTHGKGHVLLREAGIAVEVGRGAKEARRELAGFFSRVLRQRPQVTLKLAVSSDDKIAARAGERTHLTSPMASARTHLLRAQSDAILVGIGTVLADDPELTCRLPGLEDRSPIRVVLDTHGRLPSSSRLARGADATPVWVINVDGTPPQGCIALRCEMAGVRLDLRDALAKLVGQGINTVLAEGGAQVARALVEADLVNRLILIRAPKMVGGQGLDAFAGLPVATVLRGFDLVEEERLGPDSLAVYDRRG